MSNFGFLAAIGVLWWYAARLSARLIPHLIASALSFA